MWVPLPQVCQKFLHADHRGRRWGLDRDRNDRVGGRGQAEHFSFPTITDPVATVNQVTLTLGYEAKSVGDIRAVVTTLINRLRAGGKGQILDT
jgi:hypothetical protein